MIELEQFIADCRTAVRSDPTHKSVREVVARAVSHPAALLKALGEPRRAGIHKLYLSNDLTILNIVWAPHMTIITFFFFFWAFIVIYTGREDNIFWRRLPNGTIEAASAKALCEKHAEPLGRDVIHSVTNPIPRLTGAIQVYGGDFFGVPRSEWDPETLQERRFDVEKAQRLFGETNAIYIKE